MAAPDRSTGIDQRVSRRLSTHQDVEEVEEDEYALAAMGISDGFRPTINVPTGPDRTSSHASQLDPSTGRRSPPPRPSSIAKPKGIDSFALRHDGMMGPVSRRNTVGASTSKANPTRSSTVSTDVAFVTTESPYHGPAGPSHPYQMYPQESRLMRTASIATTSTVPVPERSYAGPSGPTHPYGMYPQSIVPEGENSHNPLTIAPIPVGFPGLRNDYQRRLGPDGEEVADIIGPDGHTEQLPPYSQYPDEAFARKARPIMQLPDGAGGIGLATRNPEFASREDLSTLQSRQSTHSLMSDGSSHHINTAALGASEKPQLKKWQIIARRKVGGIVPIWALVLAASVLVFFVIILASVLVALKPKHRPKFYQPNADDDNQSTVYPSMTTTFDATPLTTVPAGLRTLPTGTFSLPITTPELIESSCIDNTAQSAAWSCSIAPSSLEMIVAGIQGSSSLADNEITLSLGNDSMPVYPYGTQPPVFSTAQVMSLVTDSEAPQYGPAWFFQMPYNKLVVLSESALTPTTSKRQATARLNPGSFMRKGVAQPGEKPWFCYWNGTLLETFIYVNQTSSAGDQATSTSSSSATTATSSASNDQSSTDSSNAAASSGQSSSSSSDSDPQFLAQYPCVVKVEERRVSRGAQTIPPYCVQHVIASDGSASPYVNSSGQITTIYVNETVSSAMIKRDTMTSLEERGGTISERQATDSCDCTWMYY